MQYIKGFFHWYNRMLMDHGFITNVLSIGPLTVFGDSLTQKYENWRRNPEDRKPHDWKRSAEMSLFGFTFLAPHRYLFYEYINPWYTNILQKIFKVTDAQIYRKTAMRVLMDVGVYVWLYSAMNIYYTAIIKFRSTDKALSELKR